MKTKSASQSAFFNPRVLIGFVLCSVGLVLALAGLSKSVSGTVATRLTPSTPGTWTATGSMSVARVYFTATLLTNGKVLVAGGVNSTETTSSAELYDPATGLWTPTGNMNTPRAGHTATLLADGRVLAAGGGDGTATLSSAELYDPITGTWSLTGSMNTPRSSSEAILITSGPLSDMVVITGGSSTGGELLDTAELYDPSTGMWTYTGNMSLARSFLAATTPAALPNGSILIVGGTTCCPYHDFNEAELYDQVNQTWTPTSNKATSANFEGVLLQDGKVLVAGGSKGTQPNSFVIADAELFDPSTGVWTATASMSTARQSYTLTVLSSGQVLAAGGNNGHFGECFDVTSAELYDSSAGTWFPTGNMTAARGLFTATLLPNGQVLAVGGGDCEGNILSSAELYTPPPVATVSTTSVTFGLQLVGTSSAAQTATLTNTGTTPLTISSIVASGDFVVLDNCGASLPAGESCTIRITFNPTDKGFRTGDVTITDDAANSPQVIALAGTGTVVQLTPSSLDFGGQRVGTISRPKTVILTNTGSTPLSIRAISVGGTNFGDFVETTTCGSTVPANTSCEIDVRFAPSDTGVRRASMKVRHDGGGEQPVNLTGTGR